MFLSTCHVNSISFANFLKMLVKGKISQLKLLRVNFIKTKKLKINVAIKPNKKIYNIFY